MTEIFVKYSILVKSTEQEVFRLDPSIARMSTFLSTIIDEVGWVEHPWPFPTIDSATWRKIIEWCKNHVWIWWRCEIDFDSYGKQATSNDLESVPPMDRKFISEMDEAAIEKLVFAAHLLGIEELWKLGCKAVPRLNIDMSLKERLQLYSEKYQKK